MNYYTVDNNAKHLISYFLFLVFCACCYMYYAYFVASSIDTHEPVYGYFYPANIIDHYIYYNNYLDFKTSSINLDGVNNIGIAILYYYYFSFLECIGIDVVPEVATLILNLFVFFLCFISFKRIVIKLGLSVSVTWLFVFNSSFWYFAQLMNKDVFTIFILFKIVEYSMAKKLMSVFAIFLFSMMIRVQIPALILVYLFLIHTKPSIKNFTAIYVIISLFNGYISRYQTIFIGQETLADGFSSLVYSLNVKYGIGSLFLNPLRLVQSLYSVFDSFDFVYRYGVDVSKLKNIPQVMILIMLLPYILKCFYHYKYYMDTRIKYVIALISSFFLIWFLNPTINSRYVMLIVPFLTLIGIFYFKYRRDTLV